MSNYMSHQAPILLGNYRMIDEIMKLLAQAIYDIYEITCASCFNKCIDWTNLVYSINN